MLVMKFGGTSVQDAASMRSVLDIVRHRTSEPGGLVVVLSATARTTDALLTLARATADANRTTARMTVTDGMAAIRARHRTIVDELITTEAERSATSALVDALCETLHRFLDGMAMLGECTPQSLDEVASFGERLSTTIFAGACRAAGLRTAWFDARTVVRTDDTFVEAAIDMTIIRTLCASTLLPIASSHDVVVTQGFLGSTADGRTTTLGRGGGDYSAAILGAACGAREIDVWTDVSGIYSTDPRLVKEARPIPGMSFREVRELALYGAKVLHPDTIAPAIDAVIPVRVLNTFKPDDEGTLIVATQPDDAPIHAVTLLRDTVAITCTHDDAMTSLPDALRSEDLSPVLVYGALGSATAILRVPNEERRLSVDVATAGLSVTVQDVALICVVGPHVTEASSMAGIAGAISSMPVMGIVAGMSPVSAHVVCDRANAVDALTAIHALIAADDQS